MPALTGNSWLDVIILGLLLGFGWGFGAALAGGVLRLLRLSPPPPPP